MARCQARARERRPEDVTPTQRRLRDAGSRRQLLVVETDDKFLELARLSPAGCSVPVGGGPFRVDRFAGVQALGGQGCGLELLDQPRTGGEHVQARGTGGVCWQFCPGWWDASWFGVEHARRERVARSRAAPSSARVIGSVRLFSRPLPRAELLQRLGARASTASHAVAGRVPARAVRRAERRRLRPRAHPLPRAGGVVW
jgi:hypothetical protein